MDTPCSAALVCLRNNRPVGLRRRSAHTQHQSSHSALWYHFRTLILFLFKFLSFFLFRFLWNASTILFYFLKTLKIRIAPSLVFSFSFCCRPPRHRQDVSLQGPCPVPVHPTQPPLPPLRFHWNQQSQPLLQVVLGGFGFFIRRKGKSKFQSGKLVMRIFDQIEELANDKKCLVFVLIDEVIFF